MANVISSKKVYIKSENMPGYLRKQVKFHNVQRFDDGTFICKTRNDVEILSEEEITRVADAIAMLLLYMKRDSVDDFDPVNEVNLWDAINCIQDSRKLVKVFTSEIASRKYGFVKLHSILRKDRLEAIRNIKDYKAPDNYFDAFGKE